MNKGVIAVVSGLVTLACATSTLSAYSATKKTGKSSVASKPKELPRVMTGFPTNISVQVLRCVRANVPEFGTNNVVVLQYRLRKEGPNTGAVKYFNDSRFNAIDIKARDPVLSSSFEVIRGVHEESTYSDDTETANWQPGQTGDGYAWFKIPERVTQIDLFFPKTSPERVAIEIPKA